MLGGHHFSQLSCGDQHCCGLEGPADESGGLQAFCWCGTWSVGCQVLPARTACCFSQVRGGEVGGAGASQRNLACHHMSLCRGSSTYGRLGYGEMGNPGSPVAVAGGHSFVFITAGQEETFGVLPNGTGMAWVRRAGGPEASH